MWKHLGPGRHSTFLPSCCEIISTLRSLTCYEEQPSLTCAVLTLELSCRGILKRPYWFHYNGSFVIQWAQSWSCWPSWAGLGCTSCVGQALVQVALFQTSSLLISECHFPQGTVTAARTRWKRQREVSELFCWPSVTQWFLCWRRAFSRQWEQGWLSLTETWENQSRYILLSQCDANSYFLSLDLQRLV